MNNVFIDEVLNSAVDRGDVPGVVAIVVNRDGVLYEGVFGRARVAKNVPMDVDSIFRIASMTKALTSVAALQLVERGLLSLDGPASDVLPELADLKVLDDSGKLRSAVGDVTLRQLLTHTSGFSYPFTSPALTKYLEANGLATPGNLSLDAPLLFDPGERWQYGVSTDWVGRLVEAASGQTLEAYMREQIFAPLGMNDTGFSVSAADESRLTGVDARSVDGSLTEQPVIRPETPAVFSGGGGLTSTARDYAAFMRFILNNGELDAVRILSQESMDGLLSDQIQGSAGSWESTSPAFSNDVDLSDDGNAGHTLGFLFSRRSLPARRSAGSLSWAGIFNSYYWIDPARGIAGATFVQVLPFFDPLSVRLFESFERAVYESLS